MRFSDWDSDVCSSDLLAGQAGKGEREENGHRAERADRGRYMRGEHELAEAGRHRHLRPGGAWPPRPSPDDRGSSHTRKGTVDTPTQIGPKTSQAQNPRTNGRAPPHPPTPPPPGTPEHHGTGDPP